MQRLIEEIQQTKNILVVFLVILIFYLLSVLEPILIPLVLALLFSIMFQPLISFLKKVGTPNWLILPMISTITIGIIILIYLIIIQISSDIVDNQEFLLKRLSIRLEEIVRWINKTTILKFSPNRDVNSIMKLFSRDQITKSIGNLAGTLGTISTSFMMFTLYFVVLLAGMSNYKRFLNYVGGEGQHSDLLVYYERIQKSIYSYMIIKMFTSLCCALVSFAICKFLGINFAFLWAFITFILHFIPSVGSILAIGPPVLMAIIQYDETNPALIVLASLSISQFIIGNIIEPIIMGDKLKLNTLTVIFGLVFWGYIWGITGMILSVPLLVLTKLILEQFPATRVVSRIMESAK